MKTPTTADNGEQECREAFERELLKKYPSAKNIKRADGTYIGHMQLLWEFWQVASSKNIVATKVLEDIKMALSPAPYNASYVEFAKECRQAWNLRPTNEGQHGLVEQHQIAHEIALILAEIDGYDTSNLSGGLFDLRWSGGSCPEPLGDHFSLEYLPKGERIARHLSIKQSK